MVNSYFVALKLLLTIDKLKEKFLSNEKELSQIDCFVFLPLLAFAKQNKFDNENTKRSFLRLFNFVNIRKENANVTKASITTCVEAIRIATLLTGENIDIANYSRYESVVSSTLLNACEKYKFDVLVHAVSNRKEVEESFWKAEKLKATSGNIKFLFRSIKY